MSFEIFEDFFLSEPREYLDKLIELALEEDGEDLTSLGLFKKDDRLLAEIVAKEETILAGLPLIELILTQLADPFEWNILFFKPEGAKASKGETIARLRGPALVLLKAERVILNFICHLSGIANQTAKYVAALGESETKLLDTRKTLPGLRYPEKYAVLLGGGFNHRKNLSEMLMLKDNHIDRAGGVGPAIQALRSAEAAGISPGLPLEVECRSLDEVREALEFSPTRIMLDNMDAPTMRQAIELVAGKCETEISGGVSLENLAELGRLGADYISVGRLTHSAPYADLSMKIKTNP